MSSKFFLTLVATIGFTTLTAQSREHGCKRLQKVEQFMKDSLQLSADQQAKIKVLHDSACVKIHKSREEAKGDKEAMKTGNKAIMIGLKADYKEILTEGQLAKWREHKKATSKKIRH
jgi:protein CpxP